MNKVILTGRLTKDIELRRTQTGKAVATFSIALNRKDETSYPVCVAWEKTAELLKEYAYKGQKLGIVGHLQTRTYESKNQKHFVTEIIVEEVEFLEKKNNSVFEEPKVTPDYVLDETDPNLPF